MRTPGQRGVAHARGVANFAAVARSEARKPAVQQPRRRIHRPLRLPDLPIPEADPGGAPVAPEPPADPSIPQVLVPESKEEGEEPELEELDAYSPPMATNFQALGDAGFAIPPDTHGAAGPNHLMVTLNTQVRIQNRTTGANVVPTVTLNTFWSSVAGGSGVFDPKILYDPFAGRWMFTACDDAQSATSGILMGVSQTSDPTGSWNLYKIDGDAANAIWLDYPSMGFNKDWIVVQMNAFTMAGAFSGTRVYVFNKADLYAGGSGLFTLFSVAGIGGTQVPALTYDNTLGTMYLLQNFNGNSGGNGFLRIYTVTGAVGSEVFTQGPFVGVAAPWDSSNPGGLDFAPQLGRSEKIQNNDARIQNLVYRSGTLWAAQTVFLPAGGAPVRTAIQWWQVLPSGSILQRGRIEDTSGNTYYAFPSIAVNANNDTLVGYSQFSAAQYASSNYSFRTSLDAANTMQSGSVLKSGENSYYKIFSGTENRWGDYSSTVVDPVNDRDFWTIQEYAASPANAWGTWWGHIIPVPSATIDDVAVTEGNAGTVTASFTVSLSFASSQTVMVDYATGNGTATTGDGDYVGATGTVTFTAGQTTRPVNITVNGDTKFEPNETFVVNLSTPVNATIGDTQGQATINNDDPTPTISIDDVSVVEGDSGTVNAAFTVSLSNPSASTVGVSYATSDGSATSASGDYASATSSLSFTPGVVTRTLNVVVNGDGSPEADETLRVNLNTPVNATIADALGIGTILNDDASAGGDVQFLTATARNGQNKIEWVNPASGPYVTTMIRFRSSATACTTGTYPSDVFDGTLLTTQAAGLGARDAVLHTGLINGTTYCYSAFVQKDGLGAFSAGRNASGKPFDTTGPVKWAFDTGATALAPAGINGFAYVVSNDRGLYALSAGPGGGDWPGTFVPFEMVGPSQSRPTVSAVAVGAATRTAFVGSQDGHVYAIDAVAGAPGGVPLWTSPSLVAAGGAVQSSPSGMFSAFGGAHDLVLVGTRDGSNPNSFFGLNLGNGAIAWEFDNSAGAPQLGNGQPMGIISGQAVVDYTSRRVYFASYEGVAGAHTMWCVEFDASSAHLVWARALGDIDGSPVLRTGRVYVGTNTGLVHALDANTGADLWAAPLATDGTAIKGFVWPVRGSTRLYAATAGNIFAIEDNGGTASSPWAVALTSPSPLVHNGAFLYVGTGNGRLYEIDAAGNTKFVLLGDGSAAAGSPSMDFQNNLVYVGTTAGRFYAVAVPLP